MGMMKNYLLTLLQNCSEHRCGQDAVEYAIVSGQVPLTYDLETDLRTIMGEPGKPETGLYDQLIEQWQRLQRQHHDSLIESYQPILEEMLRPFQVPTTPDNIGQPCHGHGTPPLDRTA
ncbi:MAG: hypothetical protein C5B50_01010 [Verrucomicrobia bacterium]|nr:MAG: hypothetical protein C5B50_01010 [Verrucomicrobiota bacterium]